MYVSSNVDDAGELKSCKQSSIRKASKEFRQSNERCGRVALDHSIAKPAFEKFAKNHQIHKFFCPGCWPLAQNPWRPRSSHLPDTHIYVTSTLAPWAGAQTRMWTRMWALRWTAYVCSDQRLRQHGKASFGGFLLSSNAEAAPRRMLERSRANHTLGLGFDEFVRKADNLGCTIRK